MTLKSPTRNFSEHPLSAVRDRLFNIFTITIHIEGDFPHL